MNSQHSSNGHSHEDLAPTEVDHVLDGLRHRMRTARIRHVRFLGAVIAVVPLMGLGAVAFAQDGTGESISVASAGADDGPDDVADDGIGTDIGDADGDQQAPAAEGEEADDQADADVGESGKVADEGAEPIEPEDTVHEVDVATYGVVKVLVGADGLALIEALISEPWEFLGAETNDDGDLVIAVSDGETIKLITIGEGLWDEFHVRFDEFVVPTTTVKPEPRPEPRPEPDPEPRPEPPVVDRVVLEVSPAGSFVAEREGDTLWGGNVQVNDGFGYDIISSEGWKVHVAFFNETTVFHGKVYINDDGVLKTRLWNEERVVEAEPVYRWVEIPGVGAVQFKHHDGLMYVVAIDAFEGFGSYIYNEVGEESVKVDFEGEGQLWIVEAWAVEGDIQWSTSGPNT